MSLPSDSIGPWYTWSVGLSLHGWQAAPGDSDSVDGGECVINTGLHSKKSSFKDSEKKQVWFLHLKETAI